MDISECVGRLLRGVHLRGRDGERWSLVGRGTLGSRRLTVADAARGWGTWTQPLSPAALSECPNLLETGQEGSPQSACCSGEKNQPPRP